MNKKKILYINACVRPESRTRQLAEYALSLLDGEVTEFDLEQENLCPLNGESLASRDELILQEAYGADRFRYARAFAQADVILIAAPFWDLSFPSSLKVFIEQIMVSGLTFAYTPEGEPIPSCNARELIYITTSGGPIYSNVFGYGYICHLAETFWQIPSCKFFSAECLDLIGADVEGIMEKTRLELKASLSAGE